MHLKVGQSLLAVVAFSASCASADNWYIGPNGNDDNYGNVPSAPLKNLNGAWLGKYRFHDNDNYYFLPGTNACIDLTQYASQSVYTFNIIGMGTPENPTVIDGEGLRACATFSNNKILNFSNITFVNGSASSGGALNYEAYKGANFGVISNCVFKNCTSAGQGGAVNVPTANGTFVDCTFEGCTAESRGGAVSVQSKTPATFVNCRFANCTATTEAGGAVYTEYNDVTFERCSFTDNRALAAGKTAGAVRASNSVAVFTDCGFTNNTAASVGAVNLESMTGTVRFAQCTFAGNGATGGDVGAVGVGHTGNETTTFGAVYDGCVFTNNAATGNAGAIRGLVEFCTNTVFVANRAGANGGVWHYNGYASQAYAGAYLMTNAFVDCRFSGNSAATSGGAFSCEYAKSFGFVGCMFDGNSTDGSGGAIGLAGNSAAGVGAFSATGCRFVNNVAKSCGAVTLGKISQDVFFTGCLFTANAATNGTSGALTASIGGGELAQYGLVLNGCAFSNNTASAQGGALGTLVHNATNCVFFGNRAANGGVFYMNAYASPAYTGCYTLTNRFVDCTFASNVVTETGAVVDWEWSKLFAFESCTFTGNVSADRGCIVAGKGNRSMNLLARDCTFEGNVSADSLFKPSYSSAGPVAKPLFEGSVFLNNDTGKGSVIEFTSQGGVIDRCAFVGNVGSRTVYFTGAIPCVLRNSLVAENVSTNANGGAVYVEWQASRQMTFENNTIVNNAASVAPYGVWVDSWSTDAGTSSIKNNVIYGNRGLNGETGSQIPAMFNANLASSWIEKGGTSIADGARGCIIGTDPRFATTEQQAAFGVAAYSLRRGSAARGSGEVLDWMDAAAKDLAGNPRLRDGKVDMGCYQCWLNPVGSFLILR